MKTKLVALIVFGLAALIMGTYTALRFATFEGKDPYVVIYQVQTQSDGSTSEVEIHREKFTHELNKAYAVEIVKQANNQYIYVFTELEDYNPDEDDHHDHLHEESEYNIVIIRNGKISVIHANCPNKVCMRSTIDIRTHIYLANQIICAPHKMRVVVEAGDAHG